MLLFFQNLEIWLFGKCLKFFPYLAQMITSMRGCVTYNDLWPWLISSWSVAFGLENRVRSVASTVLDGFFPYLVQLITSMIMCVAYDDLWPWPKTLMSFDLDFENHVRSATFSVLDRLFPYLPQRNHYQSRVKFITIFSNFNFSLIFLIFRLSPWKKLQFCLHSFHIFFTSMW